MKCRICGRNESMLGQTDYHKSIAYQNNFCIECWSVTGAKTINRIYLEIVNDLAIRLNNEFVRIEKLYAHNKEKNDA